MRHFKVGLFVSDLHCPFEHPDVLAFLRALKRKYKPDWVCLSGDETDGHAISYHESDPDLNSAGDEHVAALVSLRGLYRLFPHADVLESNHGSLAERKARTAGLTSAYIKSARERIGAPKTWRWHRELMMKSGRQEILFIHGHRASGAALLYAVKRGVSLVQGHHHSTFHVQWFDTGLGPRFVCTSGCLVNPKSKAFDYGVDNVMKQLIGVTLIVNGVPRLLPMSLNKRMRWTGEVP